VFSRARAMAVERDRHAAWVHTLSARTEQGSAA
jgi:hypothetical protein